jgi:hypothetical protein
MRDFVRDRIVRVQEQASEEDAPSLLRGWLQLSMSHQDCERLITNLESTPTAPQKRERHYQSSRLHTVQSILEQGARRAT